MCLRPDDAKKESVSYPDNDSLPTGMMSELV